MTARREFRELDPMQQDFNQHFCQQESMTQTEAANFQPAFLPATPQPLPWLTFWEGPRSLAESCLDLLVGQTTSARPSAA